jgi:hypothetical protein
MGKPGGSSCLCINSTNSNGPGEVTLNCNYTHPRSYLYLFFCVSEAEKGKWLQ